MTTQYYGSYSGGHQAYGQPSFPTTSYSLPPASASTSSSTGMVSTQGTLHASPSSYVTKVPSPVKSTMNGATYHPSSTVKTSTSSLSDFLPVQASSQISAFIPTQFPSFPMPTQASGQPTTTQPRQSESQFAPIFSSSTTSSTSFTLPTLFPTASATTLFPTTTHAASTPLSTTTSSLQTSLPTTTALPPLPTTTHVTSTSLPTVTSTTSTIPTPLPTTAHGASSAPTPFPTASLQPSFPTTTSTSSTILTPFPTTTSTAPAPFPTTHTTTSSLQPTFPTTTHATTSSTFTSSSTFTQNPYLTTASTAPQQTNPYPLFTTSTAPPPPQPTVAQSQWPFPSLFKTAKNGNVMSWTITYGGGALLAVERGYVGGRMQYDKVEVKLNSSGRNLEQQLYVEANKRHAKKIKEGYTPEYVAGSKMTSHQFPEHSLLKDYKRGMQLQWPVMVQPKLDGVRIMAEVTPQVPGATITAKQIRESLAAGGDGGCAIRLRTRKYQFYNHIIHLNRYILEFVSFFPDEWSTPFLIDGELYIHGKDFNFLSGIIRANKNINPLLYQIRLYVFDVMDGRGMSYYDRACLLDYSMGRFEKEKQEIIIDLSGGKGEEKDREAPFIRKIDGLDGVRLLKGTYASNGDEVEKAHTSHVEAGYEGTVVRILGAPYVSGRSDGILKLKDTNTAEALVVGVTEGKNTEEGAAVFQLQAQHPKPPYYITFNARPKGSFEVRRQWFMYPHMVIGKIVTFEYQGKSKDDVPRFPRVICFRDYE